MCHCIVVVYRYIENEQQKVEVLRFDIWITGTGETVKNMKYLHKIGVTHVLNTAENDVNLNPQRYKKAGFGYHGFRCPDLPHQDISQFFDECVEFIDVALSFSMGKGQA